MTRKKEEVEIELKNGSDEFHMNARSNNHSSALFQTERSDQSSRNGEQNGKRPTIEIADYDEIEIDTNSASTDEFPSNGQVHPESNTLSIQKPAWTDRPPTKKWLPNRHSWVETPFLCCLAPILRYWIIFRNKLTRNDVVGWRIPFPGYESIVKPRKVPYPDNFLYSYLVSWVDSLHRSFTLGELFVFLLFTITTIVLTILALACEWGKVETGFIALFFGGLAFALAARNSIFTFLLGVPFERCLFWHKLSACCCIWYGLIHMIRVYQLGPPKFIPHPILGVTELILHPDDPPSDVITSGWFLQCGFTGLLLFSLPWIRRYFFNAFYILHILMILIVGAAAIVHHSQLVFIGIGIWGLDLLIRHVWMTMFRNPTKAAGMILPGDVIRLRFPINSGIKYNSGQYVFLMIPKINIFEWHPFSFSSFPDEDHVTIDARVLGNYTRKVKHLLELNGGSTSLRIFMEGPYGAPEIDAEGRKYKLFLLVSGGIGITPIQSTCNQMVYEKVEEGRPIKKIQFIWSCAEPSMITTDYINSKLPTYANGFSGNQSSLRPPIGFQPHTFQYDRMSRSHKYIDQDLSSVQVLEDEVLDVGLYMTRAKNLAELDKLNIWPHLRKHLKIGRPNFEKIFASMLETALKEGERKVGVMACGPAQLMNQIRALSGTYSKQGVTFDFHGETFDF